MAKFINQKMQKMIYYIIENFLMVNGKYLNKDQMKDTQKRKN